MTGLCHSCDRPVSQTFYHVQEGGQGVARRPRGPIRQRDRLFTGRVGPLVVEFWYHPHQFALRMGDWFLEKEGRRSLYQAALREDDVPKMPGTTATADDIPSPRKPAQCFRGFKELNSFLADALWPDGAVMGAVQLSLRTRGGKIVAQLKLQDHGGLRLSVEGANVDDALAGLEAALSTDPAPWERDPYPLEGSVKKRKK